MDVVTNTEEIQKRNNIENEEVLKYNYELTEEIFYERESATEIIEKLTEYLTIGIPENLNIVGEKSTGKTAVTKLLCRESTKQSKAEENLIDTEYVYIDGDETDSHYQVVSSISNVKGKGISKHITNIKNQLKDSDKQHIFVIDEADNIREHNKLLHWLSRTKQDIMIICITNDYKQFASSIEKDTKSSLTASLVHFSEYDSTDITKILRKRAEAAFKDYDLGTIRFIASNINKYCGGDIRIGLSAMKQIFQSRPLMNHKENKEEIQKVIKEQALNTQKEEIVKLLDGHIYLLWAIHTFQERNDKKPVKNSRLREEFQKVEQFPDTKRTYRKRVNDLERRGLVRSNVALDDDGQRQKYVKSNLKKGLKEKLESLKPDVNIDNNFFSHKTKDNGEVNLPHKE